MLLSWRKHWLSWFFPDGTPGFFFGSGQPLWKAAFFILGVSIAAPVSLLWPLDRLLYMGYIGITTYHNPTVIALRPLALLQFIYAYNCFDETHLRKKWQVAAGALICLLGAFIKPNLIICLLPALGIILAWRLARKQYVNFTGLLFGIGIPSGLMLAWQFLITYYGDEGSSIKFLPFAVMEAGSGYLVLKLLLSILFPLSVLILYFKQVWKDIRIVLAWLVFAFGILYTYFFAETGERFLDGNFGWSGEIALVLLFAVSTLFWLENGLKRETQKWWLYGAWSLHVLFGLVYYSFCVLNYSYR